VNKTIKSPVAGMVYEILVNPAQSIQPTEPVVIIESMKMHIEVCAERSGVVTEIFVGQGDSIAEGQALLSISVQP
jgi:oxaloacetate decarboxylase alpha subunit